MTDMAYIVSRTLEDKIAIAENIDQKTMIVTLDILKTILALLKEQGPMKPIYSEEKFGDFLPHCPVCEKVLPSISQYGKSNFCYNCGKAVKWE